MTANGFFPVDSTLAAQNYLVTVVCSGNAPMFNQLDILSLPHQAALTIIGIPWVAYTANISPGDFLVELTGGRRCHI
jgi:hypothetical protein